MSSVCKYQDGYVDIRELVKRADEESDAFAASKYNGFLGRPVTQNIFDDTNAFLAEVLLAGGEYIFSEASRHAEESIKNALADFGITSVNIGAVIAGIATFTVLSSEAKFAFAGIIIDNIKRHLEMRIHIYRDLIVIYRQIIGELVRYRLATLNGILLRVRRSKRYVDRALTNIVRLRNRLEQFRIYSTGLHRNAFTNIEAAKNALRQYNISGDIFRQPNTIERLKEKYFNRVIARQTMFIDNLTVRISRIIRWIPDFGIISKIASSRGITKWIGQQLFNLDPRVSERELPPIPEHLKNTGLIPIGLVIKQLVSNLDMFESEWEDIQRLAVHLLNALSNVENTLERLSNEMDEAIADGNTFSLTYKIPAWITQLAGLEKYKGLMEETGRLQENLARDAIALNNIMGAAEDYNAEIHEELIGSLVSSIEIIARAPLSHRYLNHSIGVCNTVVRKINVCMQEDRRLLSTLSRFNAHDNPILSTSVNAVADYLNNVKNAPGILSAVATEIQDGNFDFTKRIMKYLAGGGQAVAELVAFVRERCPDKVDEQSNIQSNNDKLRYRDV